MEKIDPGYKFGDKLKLDISYLNLSEKRHLRKINERRKKRKALPIDPYVDVLIVVMTQNDEVKFESGKKVITQFVDVVFEKDGLCPPYHLPISRHMIASFPSFVCRPADKSDLEIERRYIALSKSCPYCEERIEAFDEGGLMRYICKKKPSHHSYKYYYLNSSDYEAILRVDNRVAKFESATGIYTLNGVPKRVLPENNVYQNLKYLVDKIRAFA